MLRRETLVSLISPVHVFKAGVSNLELFVFKYLKKKSHNYILNKLLFLIIFPPKSDYFLIPADLNVLYDSYPTVICQHFLGFIIVDFKSVY